MKTILIQIQAGSDTTTFDIYSDHDSYITPIHYNIMKSQLENGFLSTLIPDNTTTIKIVSNSIICSDQYILIPITTTTTTTTTTITDTTNIKSIYPIYDGIWSISTIRFTDSISAFNNVRNTNYATTIYDKISYKNGLINTDILSESYGTRINIGRYYCKFNISDILNNNINTNNITSIKLRVYLDFIDDIPETPIILDLFEAGTILPIGSSNNFKSYIYTPNNILSNNVKISSISIYNSGYYTFNLNAFGLSVINQRIYNNQDIVFSIVTKYDSEIIIPNEQFPRISISFNSILESNINKYPKLSFITI